MKASSIHSLTSPWIDGFCTVTHLHLIISVQAASSLTLQPLDHMANLLCVMAKSKIHRENWQELGEQLQ